MDSLVKYGLTAMTDAGFIDQIYSNSLQEEGSFKLFVNAMISNTRRTFNISKHTAQLKNRLSKSVKAYLDSALGLRRRCAIRTMIYQTTMAYHCSVLKSLIHCGIDASKMNGKAIHAIGDSAHHILLESSSITSRSRPTL